MSRLAKLVVVHLCLMCCLIVSNAAFAQGPPPPPPPPGGAMGMPVRIPEMPQATQAAPTGREGKLIVTVLDQLGAVIPGATVTITGIEDATKTGSIAPLKTTDKGVAQIDTLRLGRYAIKAEFAGFEVGELKDVRVRAGDNKQAIVLPLKGLTDSVTVARDKQEAAADRSQSFGSALTREQIDALSDDPDEMRRQLTQMAGPDARILVDSFEGQELPNKAQIKSIRITRDQFAAEMHYAGGIGIEIVTAPGLGALRGSVRSNFQDSSMDGVNPIVNARGPAQNRGMGASLSGTIQKERSGFNLSINTSNNYMTPVTYVSTSDGLVKQFAPRQPSVSNGFGGSLDYALTKDQTMRVGLTRSGFSRKNQLGTQDFAERAFSTEQVAYNGRVQVIGPVGRRMFLNNRFSMNWSDATSKSAFEGPTIIVLDANTRGGAQRSGGTFSRNFTAASDLDYIRGRHSMRIGALLEGTHYRTDAATNYLGTYTFESLAAYEAGRPRSYTRRIGDPNIKYVNLLAGLYLQDDIKLRKNLTMTPGIRWEGQTHLSDYNNFAPRFGLTWSPFKSGKTTLRTSYGVFYDWLSTGTYEQTLRVDGFRQQEINISNPSYPDPGTVAALATNRYLLGDDLRMIRSKRASIGLSQTLSTKFSVGATYSDTRGANQLVGVNLNAPVNGVRPDPRFVNVIETRSDARSQSQSLSTYLQWNLSPAPSPALTAKRLAWRRGLYLSVNYSINKALNNTDGAFSTPFTSLDQEWGPAPFDQRHYGGFSVSSGFLKNFNANFSINASSAGAITIRTGTDTNGDLIFNDRPDGIGRNTLRTMGNWSSYGFFSYSIGFGKRQLPMTPGISMSMIGGAVSVTQMAAQAQPRYRLVIGANVNNLFNRPNYTGFSGVLTSNLFGKPTSASGVRSITFNASVTF